LKLVVIYGAPGVGKLTTAKALAVLTGFRMFHNHLSFDLARAVFEFPSPPFARLMQTVRLVTFEAAAREKLPGLIFTFGYASPEDDSFVQRMTQVVKRQGGELAFVRLYCDIAMHEQRVLTEERQRFGKITDVARLRDALARWNFTRTISSLFIARRQRLVDLVANKRLPTMWSLREYTQAGGLMSYGPNYLDLFRRSAMYVDKILKGANAGDLPVEQPTKFELVVNLKTAKALGLTIPPSLLARADQVIE